MAEILAVSGAWLVLSLLFCGIGALARRVFRLRVVDASDLFFDWWVGWALVVVFLLVWHVALAITVWTLVPIMMVGVAGAVAVREDWKRAVTPAVGNPAMLGTLVLLGWLAVAASTLGPDRQYDTGLYHLQSVRWAQAYPVVPGLANVDHRLGMNSTFFLFAALVENVRIHGSSLRLAAGLMFLPQLVRGIVTVHEAMIGRRRMDVVRWFDALMIPVMLWQARQYASALSPDGVVFVLAVVVSAELLRILLGAQESPDRNLSGLDWDYRVFGIALLAAIGMTVKVSFAIFAVGVVAVALWRWSKVPLTTSGSMRRSGTNRFVRCIQVLLPAIFATILWMAHGVILSGYIAFPSAIGSFPVDWRLSPSILEFETDWIVAWARSPGAYPPAVLGNLSWVPRWLAAAARDRDVLGAAFALTLAGGLRVAGWRRPRQPTNPAAARAYLFLLPSLLYVTIWLVTAPAVRLTLGPLWVLAVGTLALSLARSGYAVLDGPRMRLVVSSCLVLILATACAIALNEPRREPMLNPVRGMTTRSGLSVYVPVSGDRCGDAPLPCSSRPPSERLVLRHTGNLAKGFRIAK